MFERSKWIIERERRKGMKWRERGNKQCAVLLKRRGNSSR